jgi:hypothetical protein
LPHRSGPDRRTLLLAGSVVLFVLLLVFLLATTSGNGTGKPAVAVQPTTTAAPTTTTAPPTTTTAANPVAAQLSTLANRVRTNNGDAGPEAANRLQAIADKLRAGRNAGPDASSLATDVVGWAHDGALSTNAAQDIINALRQVPNVDLTAAAARSRGNGKGQGQGQGD